MLDWIKNLFPSQEQKVLAANIDLTIRQIDIYKGLTVQAADEVASLHSQYAETCNQMLVQSDELVKGNDERSLSNKKRIEDRFQRFEAEHLETLKFWLEKGEEYAELVDTHRFALQALVCESGNEDIIEKATRDHSKLVLRLVTVTNTKTGKTHQRKMWVKPHSALPGSWITDATLGADEEITSVDSAVTHTDAGFPQTAFIKGDQVEYEVKGVKRTGIFQGQDQWSGRSKTSATLRVKNDITGKTDYVADDGKGSVKLIAGANGGSTGRNKTFTPGGAPKAAPAAAPAAPTLSYDSEGFLDDVTKYKSIKILGGSTNAELVEDLHGTQFVMKKGANASHAKEEHIANQLYNAAGLNAPKTRLYNGDTQIAKFEKGIPLSTALSVATATEKAEIEQQIKDSFATHCLMANWDVVQNGDNVMVDDSSGKPVIKFIDNGGSLRKRARGGDKGASFGDTVGELATMRQYNPDHFGTLSDDEVADQIDKLLGTVTGPTKESTLIAMKARAFDPALAATLTKRMDNMRAWAADIRKQAALKAAKNQGKGDKIVKGWTPAMDSAAISAQVKGVDYRDFANAADNTAVETNVLAVVNQCSSQSWSGKLSSGHQTRGWAAVAAICEMRGYDQTPQVLPEKDFRALWKQEHSNGKTQLGYRTVAQADGDSFAYNPVCYYGLVGVHGAGIYAAREMGITQPPPPTRSYNDSANYGYGAGHTDHIMYPSDFKWATGTDLDKEITALLATGGGMVPNPAKATAQQTQLNAYAAYNAALTTVQAAAGLGVGASAQLYAMKTPKSQASLNANIQAMAKLTNATVGAPVRGNGQTTITITHGNGYAQTLIEPTYVSKGANPSGYQAYVRQLGDFHNEVMRSARRSLDDQVKKLATHPSVAPLKAAHDAAQQAYVNTPAQIKGGNTNTHTSAIVDILNSYGYKERRGVYAAWKGYDGILAVGGNSGNVDYQVILNRSKCIVMQH